MPKDNRIAKSRKSDEDRRFWDSFPAPGDAQSVPLPSIGADWWEAENETSATLLTERIKK